MALPPGPGQPAIVQTGRWLRSHLALLEDCRRRYGDAFTLRFTGVGKLVFVSDPDSARRLFTSDRENSLPPGRSLLLEPVLGPRSLLLLEGEQHMRRRKLMLPPFHGERMRAYEETIAAATRAEIASWPRGVEFPLRAANAGDHAGGDPHCGVRSRRRHAARSAPGPALDGARPDDAARLRRWSAS